MKPLVLFGLFLAPLFLSACGEVLIDESAIYAQYASEKTDPSGPAAVTDILLDDVEITLTAYGSPKQLTATVLPANAANQEILWTSLYPLIATVDSTGLITPGSPGSTVVMASNSGELGGGGVNKPSVLLP
ncbi:MAG: Ig-like domain-containing protein [Spirochaetaceae bacterium]|jgi:hypothetical protein|nr:Ig-like domain-containing protein [Spirochaetaceae bacterium]